MVQMTTPFIDKRIQITHENNSISVIESDYNKAKDFMSQMSALEIAS